MGLAVRLLFATVVAPHLERKANVAPDPDRYTDLAASLIDRGELGFNPPGASPTTVRGPAFPSWLAAGMLLGGRSERWIALWASVPGLVAAAAIFMALYRSHGNGPALLGGLLCAAHPLSCFVSARVLPDEFYGTLLVLGLLAWHANKASAPWIAGALLSAAALTRATAVVVILAIVGIALIARPRRAIAGGIVALVATVLLGAWTVRSSALTGRPTFVESLPGYNFWLGEAADRYGFAPDFGRSRERAHELMAEEAGTPETRSPSFWYATLGPREARDLDGKLVDAAIGSITAAPFRYVRRFVTGLMWFWIRGETATRTFQYALVALPLVVVSLLRRSRPSPALFGLTVLAHLAIYAAICPMARYSVQVCPILAFLAGAGFRRREPEYF